MIYKTNIKSLKGREEKTGVLETLGCKETIWWGILWLLFFASYISDLLQKKQAIPEIPRGINIKRTSNA